LAGAVVPTACGRCRHERREGDKFCSQCGLKFEEAVAERKIVSLLFADLCGSTALVSGVDPEDAQALLDRALLAMTEAVETYGGSVRRLQGDGVVALFGAPLAQEDHALRACLAALAIQRRLTDGADVGPALPVRIGIHSGEVVLGSIHDMLASHHRLDGAALHLAARLEQLARPGHVLISGATERLLDGELPLSALGPQTIRGFDKPVELFEVLSGALGAPATSQSSRRARTPWLGRGDLLQQLQGVATRVATGQLCVLGLRGDAGIGKTRLVSQLANDLRHQGFAVCTMVTRSYNSHLPYSALGDLARTLMGVGEQVDSARAREQARRAVASWGPEAQEHVPAATDLLDLGEPSPEWLALTPTQRRNRIGEALLWLIASRQSGPLMILAEDVFLADRDSLRTIEVLSRKMLALPVLLCLTYRPDFVHRWAEAGWFEEMRVQPLADNDMQQLARALLGRDPSLDVLLPTLLERADGNPFYLEQMSLNLIDAGALEGAAGHYRYRGGATEPGVPASIAAVIGARVDRLPLPAKATLEALAILSQVGTADTVGRMLQLPQEVVMQHLAQCCDASLLQPVEPTGALPLSSESIETVSTVTFQHALVQEVVAAGLTRPRRRQLHQAALRALQEQLGPQANEQAAVLAHHAFHGGLWTEAARCIQQAMSRAVARSANRDALRMLETGLEAAAQIDDTTTRLSLELALRSEALSALWPLGHFEVMFVHLEHAQRLTTQLDDPKRQAGVSLQQAVLHWGRGSPALGLTAARTAQHAAIKAGSRGAQMAAAQVELMLYHGLGRYAELVERARHLEEEFAPELVAGRMMLGWATLPGINLLVFAADALARLGDEDEAQATCDRAYRELQQREHAFSRTLLDFTQASLWLRQGRHAQAAQRLRMTHQLCLQHDLLTMTPCIVGLLAEALGPSGGADEAQVLVERAIADKAFQIAGLYSEFFLRYGLGRTMAVCGRLDEAQAHLLAASVYAEDYEQWGHQADALLALGELALQRGDGVAAAAYLDKAGERARHCGMRKVLQRADALLHSAGV
jgi:class 3 adenylate cyclase/tetratricopeptide (TPR) repeat protein